MRLLTGVPYADARIAKMVLRLSALKLDGSLCIFDQSLDRT